MTRYSTTLIQASVYHGGIVFFSGCRGYLAIPEIYGISLGCRVRRKSRGTPDIFNVEHAPPMQPSFTSRRGPLDTVGGTVYAPPTALCRGSGTAPILVFLKTISTAWYFHLIKAKATVAMAYFIDAPLLSLSLT